ncbi:MAG: hypothetical protein H7145_20145 [Akkermansiaceae bacterium]|nr:hypothetical protein [Armatimonadota bacterium]
METEKIASLVEPIPKDDVPSRAGRGSLLNAVYRSAPGNNILVAQSGEPDRAVTGAQNNELILDSFNDDLLKLVNLTQSTLTRAMRPQSGGMTEGVLGPLQKGIEIAGRIEQRGRSLLLETSLTKEQRPRVLCATQNAQDQSVALRSARYAWQTCAILTSIPGGNGTFARVKRLVAAVTELNGKVSGVLETGQGTEKAAAAEVAVQYRAVLTEQSEILTILRHDISAPPLVRRLGRAAVMSLVIAGESMARLAARLAYPESATTRPTGSQPAGLNDGILRPLSPR